MRAVVLSNDALFGDGLRCILAGQAWCTSVEVVESSRALASLLASEPTEVVVATVDQMEIGELAELEAAKREFGFRVVAVASADSLPSPMDRVADQVANRSKGFEGLRRAMRSIEVRAGNAVTVREPLATYGLPRKLTQREREVARLVSQGLPNRRIAKVLGIQEQSVKNVVSVVMRKLDCENRVQVALHLSAPSH